MQANSRIVPSMVHLFSPRQKNLRNLNLLVLRRIREGQDDVLAPEKRKVYVVEFDLWKD